MHKDFIRFMEESTTAYQAVYEVMQRLESDGYERLCEAQQWDIRPGDKKYVVRNDSSIIAFRVPQEEANGFHMICAHSDSPSFKMKENAGIVVEDSYLKINVENYGGMRKETWVDRPLSVAGRIVIRKKGLLLESIRVDMKRPLFLIPSLAVHMKRGDAKESELNTQMHLLPLAGTINEKDALMDAIAKEANVEKEDILGMDLYLYPVQKPLCMGLGEELIGAARLDDLACVYCGMKALQESHPADKISVLAIFDNEEVGSQTMQGAASDFLFFTLQRVAGALEKELSQLLAGSFLISADNAHALHPNYVEKSDPTNRPILNKGIVIKYHGAQKYTTSAYSGAFVKALCEQEHIPYQTYHNRSDIAGGSTLGNIALTGVSVQAADIGLPQLAMHSAFETAGIYDIQSMIRFMTAFYQV